VLLRDELADLESETFEIHDLVDVGEDMAGHCSCTSTCSSTSSCSSTGCSTSCACSTSSSSSSSSSS
jgi:hypothetical protein